MGEARKRGSFEERKQESVAASSLGEVSEETKQQVRDHLEKLAKAEDTANRTMITAYWKYTKMEDRILTKAATPQELKGL